MSVPGKLVGLAVSGALLLATPVHAGEGDVTPESASNARFGVEQQGKVLSDRGDFDQAAELYWREGVRLKDPVLILDSAEALRDRAAAERSIDAARSAIDRAAPALDMLYYLRDSSTSAAWQPVAPEYVGTVITRAESLITDAEALIAAIEDEQRKAAEAALTSDDPGKTRRERGPAKPGTGLIAAGSAVLVVGLGGAGLGVAGLALGARAQSEVEDPLVYEPEHSAAEQRGKSANVLAGVGLALAGVGVSAGVALIVLGIKKRKQAGDGAAAMVVPIWFSDGHEGGAGLGLVGRF
ncbi:MAG TPA: hypothetical protein VK034_13830 [Enhygromyxa sp.]|nr:hypothetical protein [Enhygromyxa sp.]